MESTLSKFGTRRIGAVHFDPGRATSDRGGQHLMRGLKECFSWPHPNAVLKGMFLIYGYAWDKDGVTADLLVDGFFYQNLSYGVARTQMPGFTESQAARISGLRGSSIQLACLTGYIRSRFEFATIAGGRSLSPGPR
ncbi:MAG: hypothetical protein WKF37_09640 [Bryobacteraceae bacterium]